MKAERRATPKKGSEGEREAPCIKLGQLIVKRSQMSRVVVHNGAHGSWRMGRAGMKGKKEQMVVGPLGRTGPRAKRRGSGRWVGQGFPAMLLRSPFKVLGRENLKVSPLVLLHFREAPTVPPLRGATGERGRHFLPSPQTATCVTKKARWQQRLANSNEKEPSHSNSIANHL